MGTLRLDLTGIWWVVHRVTCLMFDVQTVFSSNFLLREFQSGTVSRRSKVSYVHALRPKQRRCITLAASFTTFGINPVTCRPLAVDIRNSLEICG